MSVSNGLGKPDNLVAGQLIIKASVGDDIRRIPILNDDLTYDELILMMQRVFRGVLETNEELVLKYKDEDGDLVSLTDTNDLSHAIHYSRVLRLTILQQNATGSEKNNLVDTEVVKELRSIRDKVNHLLDKVVIGKSSAENNKVEEAIESSFSETVASVANLNLEQNKEFDPLGQEQPIVAASEKTRQASGQSSVSSSSAPGQGHAVQPPQPQASPVYPPQPQAMTQSAASYPSAVPQTQTAASYPSAVPQTQATPYPGPGGSPAPASAHYPGAPASSGYSGSPASSYATGPPTGTNTYSAQASGPGMAAAPNKTPYPGGPPSGPPNGNYGYPQTQQPQQQPGAYPQSTPNNFPGYPGQQPGAAPMPGAGPMTGQQHGAGPMPGQQPGPYGAPAPGGFNANPYSRAQPGQGYPRPPQ